MYKLVLMRHGQTVFNKQKIFCGWTDVDLTEQGIQEAETAGKNLKAAGYTFDMAFCSVLKRAIETLDLALDGMGIGEIPVEYSWRLNERHYGALQGLKHEDIAKIHTPEQVHIWRRSFDVKPPQLEANDPRHPCNDAKYCDIDKKDLPCGESLSDTIKRVLPYWHETIAPRIKSGKKVVIVASNNSLRALVKYIDNIGDADIVGLELKTGTPIVYELDKDLKPLKKYYLVDGGKQEEIPIQKSSQKSSQKA